MAIKSKFDPILIFGKRYLLYFLLIWFLLAFGLDLAIDYLYTASSKVYQKQLETYLVEQIASFWKEKAYDQIDSLFAQYSSQEIGLQLIRDQEVIVAQSKTKFPTMSKRIQSFKRIPARDQQLFLSIYDLKGNHFLKRVKAITNLVVFFLILALIAVWFYFFYRYIYHKEQLELAMHDTIDHHIPLPTLGDSYRALINMINALLEQKRFLQTKISKRKEGFFVLLESIQQALWIQNKKGIITAHNQSFHKLMGNVNVRNRYFWNVIRQRPIYLFVNDVYQHPRDVIQEIEYDDSTLLASASYSEAANEIFFILHDISQIRQLESIKRDFILNVSHELRTPLTAIKGFLEMMEDEVTAQQKFYVDVITRNTERLIRIVEDLLTLSRLEHDDSLELEEIEMNSFFSGIKTIFDRRLEQKKLDMKIQISQKPLSIKADRYKLEQVFINLIDNAIKYTEAGEISLSCYRDSSFLFIEVQDTGLGIPEEHLPRLFERFYVVNKSRARKYGSTGLGLSIVKHIIQLHKGTIKVSSKEKKGTKFQIILPFEQKLYE